MPALTAVSAGFAVDRPLTGHDVLLNLHVTPETARLGAVLAAGGARVRYVNSGRVSPSAQLAARIASHGGRILATFADLDASDAPLLVVEGNGRVFTALHGGEVPRELARVRGISLHTSGGGRRVDEFEERGEALRVPVVAVYRSELKGLLETGLGTSQSTASALLRGLGVPLAGRRVAVIGFGRVGEGIARFFRVLGARITVVEIRAEAALKAKLSGYRVATPAQALRTADMVITTVGAPSVLTAKLFEHARDGVIVGNVSDCPTEIDTTGCRPVGARAPAYAVWETPSGRRFTVLVDGVQVNHMLAGGNPAELMDLSFSLHALSLRWLVTTAPPPAVYAVPAELREHVAALCMGSGW